MTSALVVFDLERIRDRATNLYPRHYPEGIDYVFVNGVLVVDGEQHTGAFPGQVLRHRIKTSDGVSWENMLLKGRLCLAHSRAVYPQFV